MISVRGTLCKTIRVLRIFFADDISTCGKCGVDIYRFIRIKHSFSIGYGIERDEALTLVSQLEEEEEMLKHMHKNVCYEIRRCSTKDTVKISFYDSGLLTNNDSILRDFHNLYDHFCDTSKQPTLKADWNTKRIGEYCRAGALYVSLVEYDNGKTYHMYVGDGGCALLIYSASDFRNADVDRNLAARANKYLHFCDMKRFGALGFKEYDWGNVSSFDTPNGIDIFKLSFGGEQKIVYNYSVGASTLGKLIVEVSKHIGWLS